MTYVAAFCKTGNHQAVRDDIGANDSKQLKEIDRERMLKSIENANWVGYTGEFQNVFMSSSFEGE